MEQVQKVRTSSSFVSEAPGPRFTRYEVDAVVLNQRPITGHEYEITFLAPQIARTACPGQFVEILFGENYSPLVRRPFSLYKVNREAGTCSVLYIARGAFTSGMSERKPGDVVSLLGPLGRPFRWPADPGIQHILVAGGLGAPPLYFLASELSQSRFAGTARSEYLQEAFNAAEPRITEQDSGARDHRPHFAASSAAMMEEPEVAARLAESKVVVINAARTELLLVGLTEFGDLDIVLHVMTDDGSRGVKGMATEQLKALLDSEAELPKQKAIYACGPMAMLRSVGEIAISRGLPCQVSIETSMPCGIGLCQGCAVPVWEDAAVKGFTYKLACVDGPVFEASELVWP